jgi:hypothetical protein
VTRAELIAELAASSPNLPIADAELIVATVALQRLGLFTRHLGLGLGATTMLERRRAMLAVTPSTTPP